MSKTLTLIFKLGRYVDDERRFRAGVLGGILMGAAVASLILAGIIPNAAQRAAVAAIAAIALVCALLLRLGKLEPAAMAMSATIALVAYATVFMAPFHHNSEIFSVGFYGIFSLVLAGLITGGKAGFILTGALGYLAFGAQLMFRRIPSGVPIEAAHVAGYAVVALVYTLGLGVLMAVAERNRRLVEASASRAAEEHTKAEAYAAIVAEARKGLDAGEQLTASAEHTERLVRETREMNARVRESLASLLAEAKTVGLASEAMAEASRSTGAAVSEQVSVIEETSAAVVEMTASIEAISRIAMERQGAIAELTGGVERGSSAIAKVTEAMAALNARVADTAEVVKVIKKVASQTGLLAMNASIEAAHAGDAGGGFAVVAEEIRRLADDTAVNAKKVADTLGAVASAIGQAVATNEEAAEAYALVRAEIDKVAGAISEIAQGVSELSSGTDEINKGTTLSVNVTQSVREAVVQAADRVGEVERGVRAQESAAKAIGEAISQTAARLDGLADEATKVKLAGAKNHETLGELGRRLAGLSRSGRGEGPAPDGAVAETGISVKSPPRRA
jgi:methyl-accepting chemotaxis protein